ncbi:M15 family metallopeptidase [Sphaerisporangium sp. NPDC051017]|uniref:M15 family metallopeptidase n=1 Tax=Sphaerisporangium sp. NPDC051017 TaxID=3154636 RepID=UPI00341B5CD9
MPPALRSQAALPPPRPLSGYRRPARRHPPAPVRDTGDCHTASTSISTEAAGRRHVLGEALEAAGLVNYPTEWWHWSYGNRYWAYVTGASAARYGPMTLADL